MFSVNCPACGQKVVEAEGDCDLTSVCPKCRATFRIRIADTKVAYELVRGGKAVRQQEQAARA